MEKDIDIVEKAYRAHNLPPVFTMHELYEPESLKDKLLTRGYELYDHTRALGVGIDEIQSIKILNYLKY